MTRARTLNVASGPRPRPSAPLRPSARRLATAALLTVVVLPTPLAFAANVDPLDLEDEVVCVVCERPLSVSAGSAAEDQRDVIKQLADQGLTKDQIKAKLVDEYGEGVLVDDKSWVAASAPWIAAVVGVASITLLLVRRGKGSGDHEPAATAGPDGAAGPAPEPNADDDARIEAELAARD